MLNLVVSGNFKIILKNCGIDTVQAVDWLVLKLGHVITALLLKET